MASRASACFFLTIASIACGGPTPPTSPRAYGDGIFEGTVTRVLDGTPIPGARLRLGVRETTADEAGRFRFDDLLELGRAPVIVSADGYVSHETQLRLGTPRTGVSIDLIPGGPPFQLWFFRQMVRNATPSSTRYVPLRRWTVAPSFFFKTTQEPTGREVPVEIIDRIEALFRNAVPELSGGRLGVAEVARGPEVPAARTGWVVVRFMASVGGPTILGRASVGGNSGTMSLRLDPDDLKLFAADYPSGCYAQSVQVSEHELFHTMGFWHAGHAYEGPTADPGCDGRGFAEILRYHAAVAYSRPVGNRDPDVDPTNAYLADAGGPGPDVACEFGGQILGFTIADRGAMVKPKI